MAAPPALKTLVKTDLGNTRRQEQSAKPMKRTQRYGNGWKRTLVILMLIHWECTQQGRDVFCKDPFSWDSLGRRSGFLAIHHMWEIPSEYNRALLVFCVSTPAVFNECLIGKPYIYNSCVEFYRILQKFS